MTNVALWIAANLAPSETDVVGVRGKMMWGSFFRKAQVPGPANFEEYWIDRHRRLNGRLAAVGDIGATEGDNAARYARKKRRIVDLLRELGSLDLKGKRIVDAGCGTGQMSELFYALGADVVGVDVSEVAVAAARSRCPQGQFSAAPLTEFTTPERADIVFCIDVLYHVVEDDKWQSALARLCEAADGMIVIVDQLKAAVTKPAAHVHYRTREIYDGALGDLGFAPVQVSVHSAYFMVYARDNRLRAAPAGP